MSRGEGGYIMLEMLVSLAIVTGMVVTVAGIARDVLRTYQRTPNQEIPVTVHRTLSDPDRPVPSGYEVKTERIFENGDRWIVYRRTDDAREESLTIPVFVPSGKRGS